MSEAGRIRLNEPLPADAVVGGWSSWFGYRRYPVFSARWLSGRLLYLGSMVLALAVMAGLGNGVITGDAVLGVTVGGLTFGSFILMFFAGPALACWVRHRRWRASVERFAVVVAVLLGIFISYAVDSWASARLEPMIEQRSMQHGMISEQQIATAKQMEKNPLSLLFHLLTLATIYLLMGGGLALRGYFTEQRRLDAVRQQAELRNLQQKAQLDALKLGVLQAQVEPHFLFNTLASIRSLLRQDLTRAEATLDALVDHLRATMPRLRNSDDTVAGGLAQQIEICRSYLELMKLRMGERLDYSIELPSELAEHPFPPLLLITLVENAIKHGIEPKRGQGRIRIRASVQDRQLWLRVEDDGAGLQPGAGSGVGLANIRAQLATLFAERAGVRLLSRPGGGVVAELWIPFHDSITNHDSTSGRDAASEQT